jgi:hypothetical protein
MNTITHHCHITQSEHKIEHGAICWRCKRVAGGHAIIIMRGYFGAVFVFDNEDGKGWRGKVPDFTFRPPKTIYSAGQHRKLRRLGGPATITPRGAFTAAKLLHFLGVTLGAEVRAVAELDNDMGILWPVPVPRKRRIKRGLL